MYERESETDVVIRKKARRRSSLVQGTGFALLGHRGLAIVGLGLTAVALAALVTVSFYPSAVMAWLVLLSLLVVVNFWVAEYLAVGWMAIRPEGESGIVSRHFLFICAVVYIAAIAAVFCLLANFGTLRLYGEAMAPVVQNGERVLYHKRVLATDLVRGKLAAFRVSPASSWGRPGDVVLARIIAVPGDALAIRDGRYLVNDQETHIEVGAVGRYKIVVEVPEAPDKITVPPDSYFVVQEQPSTAFDSRTLSWMRGEEVLGTKLWLVSMRGILREL